MPERTERKGPPPCRPAMCGSCVFRRPGERVELAPGRLEEITAYLVAGKTHLCHTPHRGEPNAVACRGGRDLQLKVWHAAGMIAEPTDAALAEAMAAFGL